MPEVSVCIPTFDRRGYLEELLDALLREPGADRLQIVVSDNASTDGTEDLCRSLAQRWPQIKYIRKSVNEGPDRNFLSAVEHADAPFCWLFGSDDLPRPGAVARVLELVRSSDPDILLFDRVWCDIEMHPTRVDCFLNVDGERSFDTRQGRDVRLYLEAGTGLAALLSYLSSVVVRKSRWDAAPPMDRYLGSAYIHTAKLLWVFAAGSRVHFAPEPLALCRGDNEGLMEHGIFNRARIDFVWYERMLDEFFPLEPAHGAALAVVRREYGLLRLLLLLAHADDGEAEELLHRMRAFAYPELARLFVAVPARSPLLRAGLGRVAPVARHVWWRRMRRRTAASLP
jgi:abequosyltransferase